MMKLQAKIWIELKYELKYELNWIPFKAFIPEIKFHTNPWVILT